MEFIRKYKRTDVHPSAIFHGIAEWLSDKRLVKNLSDNTLNLLKNNVILFLPDGKRTLNLF